MESAGLELDYYEPDDVIPYSPPLVPISPEKLDYPPGPILSPLALWEPSELDLGSTPFVRYFNGKMKVL